MATTTTESRRPRRLQARLIGTLNPLVMRIARFVPFYCVLEHRGRRTGQLHRNPLAAVRTADGFLLPLAFGERANWVLNVRAAGGATVEWRGRRYTVSAPEMVGWEEGAAALNAVERRLAPVFGAHQFMRVIAAPSSR